ncbi:hypothetical protein EYW49_22045 [Siculibacillus lacustris]|uniref:Core-binding (CB) domain-containing protein n=1 Tax=Siculibacillus lacustris TaxID=1549641 RepID=A0A4Q9VCV6_9HYPH|nr:hypothetical protein [Siculibacillus lacustris]TBW32421.1 hypothetical protein EYW49_22045 [Siculibacillus lacustris]
MTCKNQNSNSYAVQADRNALGRVQISPTDGVGGKWQWRAGVQFQVFSGATLRTELDHRPRILREGRISDTREASADNRERVFAYLDFLDRSGLALPADAQWPNRLSVEIAAKEAGVARDSIASVDSELRRVIDGRLERLGLAEIVSVVGSRSAFEPVALFEARGIVARQVMQDAGKAGRPAAAMVRRVEALFTRLVHRADGGGASALEALRCLLADADAGELRAGVDDRPVVEQAIATLETFEARRWASAESGVNDGLAASFSEALTQIVYGTGLPFHRVAQLAGVKATALRRWMHDERVPDRRNEAVLREICRLAGREPDGLLARIRRRRHGTARLYEADFPSRFHGADKMRMRSRLASRIPLIPGRGPAGEDAHLTAAIETLAADHDRHFARGRRRQKLRESARMGEPPESFGREVEAYLEYLRDDRPIDKNREHEALRPATIATYRNLLRRFGAFVVSDRIDPSLRIDGDGLSLAHIAVTPLWRAFFAHKLSYREEHERLDTATVDRLHVALLLISAEN